MCIVYWHKCFIIAPLCECDQRISTTILVLRNSNNTTLSSRDVLTSASLPILLSSLTQQPHTPPPDLYGGSRPARGGAGKPNTPPRGFQHQFPGSQSRGWLNSYSHPGVNSLNKLAIFFKVLLKDTARIANGLAAYAKGTSRPLVSDYWQHPTNAV